MKADETATAVRTGGRRQLTVARQARATGAASCHALAVLAVTLCEP